MSEEPAADAKPAPAPHALSVVVPAYQEERRIASTVTALRGGLRHDWDRLEVVVVDDGSTDATASRAAEAGADRVVRFDVNRGKGAAVRAGMLAASGAVRVFTDADLSYAPAEVARVAAAVREGTDVAVGSRRAADERRRAGRKRDISHRLFQRLTRLVVSGHYADTQCGLKAFSAPAAEGIFSATLVDGFAFDVEVFLLAERRGLRVREVAVRAGRSDASTVRVGAHAAGMVSDLVRMRRRARRGGYEPDAASPGAKEAVR